MNLIPTVQGTYNWAQADKTLSVWHTFEDADAEAVRLAEEYPDLSFYAQEWEIQGTPPPG